MDDKSKPPSPSTPNASSDDKTTKPPIQPPSKPRISARHNDVKRPSMMLQELRKKIQSITDKHAPSAPSPEQRAPHTKASAELYADLIHLFGLRASTAMRCLRIRHGVAPNTPPDEDAIQAMRLDLLQALHTTGTWWTRHEPLWLSIHGFRPRGDLLVWLQHLRMEAGEAPEVFSPRNGRDGDPMWTRASRWMGAQISEMLLKESIPPRCHPLLKERARRMVCDPYGLKSTRHLPASICMREAIRLLLQCELHGIANVLDLDFVLEQLAREQDDEVHHTTEP